LREDGLARRERALRARLGRRQPAPVFIGARLIGVLDWLGFGRHTRGPCRTSGSATPGTSNARPPFGPLTRAIAPGCPAAWRATVASRPWTTATVRRSAERSL